MEIAQRSLNLQRMEALESYGDLAEPFDPGLQDLVRFAAEVCESPISVVTTVEGGELRLQANLGLGGPLPSFEESFCAHAMDHDGLFEVGDAAQDDRFRSNPMVVGPSAIRYYSGVSIRDRSGVAVGSFCVIDLRPRELTAFQRRTLLLLGRQAEARLELMRSLQALREERLARTRVSAERERLILELEHERARLSALLDKRPESASDPEKTGQFSTLEAFY